MAVLTTPTTQTVHGSIIDQANFQKSGVYATTTPAVYLTRILSRMMAAAHSPNSVLTGLDVIATSGLNTRTVTFTLSPGSMIIDSHIVHFNSPTTISTDLIPLTAPSKLRVGIFAAFTFNAATAETTANNVVFSSYLFDMNDNLVAPTLFGGSEKILLTSFIIDMQGTNLTPSMRPTHWIEIGNAATLSGTGAKLAVTNTQNYPGYAYINTTIPTSTICDFTILDDFGNASVRVGNTIPNSFELLNLSSGPTGPNTLTGQFTTTSNNQIVSLGNTSAIAGDSTSFDNVQISYPSSTNELVGDDSTFATSIGNWVPSGADGAYWDGVGAMLIRPARTASIDFVIGTDLVADTVYRFVLTTSTNFNILIGTTGVSSFDVKPPASTTTITFKTPLTGILTVTLESLNQTGNASIPNISLFESAISEPDSFQAINTNATVGSWIPSTIGAASVAVVANNLQVTNIAGTTAAQARLVLSGVTIGVPYTFQLNSINVPVSAFTISAGTAVGLADTATGSFTLGGVSSLTITPTTSTVHISITPPLVANSILDLSEIVMIKDVSPTNVPTDTSTFTASIGNWVSSTYAAQSTIGMLNLYNTIAASASISSTITLLPNTNYQVELTGLVGGLFRVLDGVTQLVGNTLDGTTIFQTTAATSYNLDFTNSSALINGTASLDQVNIFERLDALSVADSTFTSIASWKTSAFDNVQYIGDGLEMSDNLGFGAEISRTLTGLTNGVVYRVQMQGYGSAQMLVGNTIGSGNLLTATGIVNTIFTANATTAVITLRVNSTLVGASAKFIGVKVFVDNYRNARVISPSNSKASGGNLKALSINNTSNTIKTEIVVPGHGTFKVKGDSKISTAAELGVLNGLSSSVASWVIDIPKMKPTATTLAYNITEILL